MAEHSEKVDIRSVREMKPGTYLQHVTGSRVCLKNRKADESGWWNTDKSGFSDAALQEMLSDGTWVVVNEPESVELPSIDHVQGRTVPAALRRLADRFEQDENLVLIGLWNVEGEHHAITLQVVTTRIEAPDGR